MFPASQVSLGVDGGDDLHCITAQTLLMLNVPYGEARDVFKLKTSAEQAGQYQGRPRGTLLVSERMRRAVMEPHEPVVYQMASVNGSGSLGHSMSLTAQQSLVDSYRAN